MAVRKNKLCSLVSGVSHDKKAGSFKLLKVLSVYLNWKLGSFDPRIKLEARHVFFFILMIQSHERKIKLKPLSADFCDGFV
jgi:hypothetical protein